MGMEIVPAHRWILRSALEAFHGDVSWKLPAGELQLLLDGALVLAFLQRDPRRTAPHRQRRRARLRPCPERSGSGI